VSHEVVFGCHEVPSEVKFQTYVQFGQAENRLGLRCSVKIQQTESGTVLEDDDLLRTDGAHRTEDGRGNGVSASG
jgi:hypothetical protein